MTNTGKPYEDALHANLKRAAKAGKLPFPPDLVQVERGKKYFSRDRNSEIKTDVSIEVFRPKATDYFLLWLWETKDLTRKVSVDDVEEFWAKMQQLSAHKGTIVSPLGFAKGSLAYAESKKIGLGLYKPPGKLSMLMEQEHDPPSVAEVLVEGLDIEGATGEFYWQSSDAARAEGVDEFLEREFRGI